MFIPFDPPHQLLPLKEEIELTEDILDERLHSYSWQQPVAKEVAHKLYPYIGTMDDNEKKYTFDIETPNSLVKKVEVIASKVLAYSISGGFMGFNNSDKKAILMLIIPIGYYKTENEFVDNVTSVLSHELNHAGTAFNKYDNEVEFDGVDDYYENILNLLNTTKIKENDAYYFAYSLYCTHRMEITAFISQTESQLYQLSGKKKLTIDEIKQYLPNTLSYTAFLLAKNTMKKWIGASQPEKEYFIDKLINEYKFPIKNFDKLVKTMYNRAQYALEKTCANAMNCLV